MDEQLVSIVIPTYNSEKTLPLCLKTIKNQCLDHISKNVEIIVVDSFSRDRTVEIAKKYGARVIQTHGGLLWARYIGHLYAKGAIELLLDSDQLLHPTAIKRGVKMIIKGCDMIIFEETSYKPRTLIQWLFYIDRKYAHNIKDLHPIHGVLLARMYKYEILDNAFKNIKRKLPQRIMYKIVSQDHAIIYYEAWKYANKLGILRDAIYHIEPFTLTQVIKKFYRYGKTEFSLSKFYPELSKGKKTPRKIGIKPESWLSLTLWIIKAVPYTVGRLLGNHDY
ncbi:MAG: glycosyltransferase family 2 protein [Candidatus Baldrarchaeia archaeon]